MRLRFRPRLPDRIEPLALVLAGILLGAALWFSGVTPRRLRPDINPLAGPPLPGRISVMAYNLENLFDEVHDPDHDDFAFLPLAEKRRDPETGKHCAMQAPFRRKSCLRQDWSAEVVRKKIAAVAGAIRQVHGQGPDVLIVEEVENRRILQRLNDEGLAGSYRTVVWLPGRDPRGIAVGLLSRLPLAGEPRLHPIEPANDADGLAEKRGILEVPLRLPNGRTLWVLGVHFPSQSHPVQDRIEAIARLREILQQKDARELWVVGGDWNITNREDLRHGLVQNQLAALGWVSHRVGCETCAGTHFYQGEWDFLDILLFSKNFVTESETKPGSPRLVTESVQTPTWAPGQVDPRGRPRRFDPKRATGVSDHLPIYAEIESGDAK